MIKSELVERIAALSPHLYGRDLKKVVNAMLDEIVAALCRRDRVEIRGFGVFSVRSRRARIGRNPPTAPISRSNRNPFRSSSPERKCGSASIVQKRNCRLPCGLNKRGKHAASIRRAQPITDPGFRQGLMIELTDDGENAVPLSRSLPPFAWIGVRSRP
jgi:nucleoid DNA-binding protein